MEATNKLTINTYSGAVHQLEYIPIMTTGELKTAILQIDHTVPDFDFMYAGKMIRSSDKVL